MTTNNISIDDYRSMISGRILSVLDETGCQPILFVGSGISQRYFSAPTWLNLLERLIADCPLCTDSLGFLTQKYNNDLPAVGSELVEIYRTWAWKEGRALFPDELFSPGRPRETYLKYYIAQIFKDTTPASVSSLDNNEHIDEIKSLLAIQPHAVITTNYDNFMENIFEGYETHIGYDVIKYNNITFGDIHKIHGGCDRHEDLIITREDYQEFNKKSTYLSAKLLTYFCEHLLIFIGYSATDLNIRAILSDIDIIVGSPGSLKKNLFFLDWADEAAALIAPQERLINLENGRYVRVNNIVANDFNWVFKALGQRSAEKSINPRILRSLMHRMYRMVRSEIPRNQVDVDFAALERATETGGTLAKMFGLTFLSDKSSVNLTHPHLISELAELLEFGRTKWNRVNNIISEIKDKHDIDIKSSDNRYHQAVKSGKKRDGRPNVIHKYSPSALELFRSWRDGLDVEIKLFD